MVIICKPSAFRSFSRIVLKTLCAFGAHLYIYIAPKQKINTQRHLRAVSVATRSITTKLRSEKYEIARWVKSFYRGRVNISPEKISSSELAPIHTYRPDWRTLFGVQYPCFRVPCHTRPGIETRMQERDSNLQHGWAEEKQETQRRKKRYEN